MKFNPAILERLGIDNPEEMVSEQPSLELEVPKEPVDPLRVVAASQVPVPDISYVVTLNVPEPGYVSPCEDSQPACYDISPVREFGAPHYSDEAPEQTPEATPEQVTHPSADKDANFAGDPGADKDDVKVSESIESGAESSEAQTGLCSRLKDPLNLLWELTMPDPKRYLWPLFAVTVAWIGACSYVMSDAVYRVGCILTFHPFVMGKIFSAAGTSIPDLLCSISVAKDGGGDMAVANALGSNVFDILIGLGVPWTIRYILYGEPVHFPGEFHVLIVEASLLVVVLCIFVGMLVLNRWRLTWKFGVILLMFYVCYVIYALTSAMTL